MTEQFKSWHIYRGTGLPHDGDPNQPHQRIDRLPDPPPWRNFEAGKARSWRGKTFRPDPKAIELVNAALYLRRPLLITGKPGNGKSSLAYHVAEELGLGEVLLWPINSRTTLKDGLYTYDPLRRLHSLQVAKAQGLPDPDPGIGAFIKLGPLGTALLPRKDKKPRVLLIDEIDKSDIDLPNDLLSTFEDGFFEIRELERQKEDEVLCFGSTETATFPLVVLTSNGERALPPAFLRRCIRLDIPSPKADKLGEIVQSHFAQLPAETNTQVEGLIDEFLRRAKQGDLATDQLLNAIYLVQQQAIASEKDDLINTVFRHLSNP